MTKSCFKQWLKALVMILSLGSTLTSCSDDGDNQAPEWSAIRGYWVCESKDLALEIISQQEYHEAKGENVDCSPQANVYQLWCIEGTHPVRYVAWTSEVGYLYFNDPQYDWQDKVYVAHVTEDKLYLDGIDTYLFERVSKQYFDDLVNRNNVSDGDDDGGNDDGGSDVGGGNSGGSSNHHFPCKSCDESGKCWNCFGSGTDPITHKKCNTCHGTGKCQSCHGRGYIIV